MNFIPRSETTRRFIIESTAEVFNKKGYVATSITDLEKVTGLTKGSIYGNFENKDALALAVFDYNLSIKLNFLKQKSAEKTSYRDKLLVHVLSHYPSAKSPFTPGGCPIQNTAIEAINTNPELQKCAAAGLMTWTNTLVAEIKEGVRQGEFKPVKNPISVAAQIISMIEGGALYALSTGEFSYAEALLEAAKKIIMEL